MLPSTGDARLERQFEKYKQECLKLKKAAKQVIFQYNFYSMENESFGSRKVESTFSFISVLLVVI